MSDISLITDILKSSKAEVGEERTWSDGRKYRKTSEGWEPVSNKQSSDDSGSNSEKVKVESLLPEPSRNIKPNLKKEIEALADGYYKWWVANKKDELQGKSSETKKKMQNLVLEQMKTLNAAYGYPYNVDQYIANVDSQGEKTNKYQDSVESFKEENKKVIEEADKKQEKAKEKVVKSVLSMDEQGSAIETANYNIDRNSAPTEWLEKFYAAMKGFNYGDAPRVIDLTDGYSILLAKVDDGLYSGFVRQSIDPATEEVSYENTGKVEKQTIPTIISYLLAKEYIKLPVEESKEEIAESITEVINNVSLESDSNEELDQIIEEAEDMLEYQQDSDNRKLAIKIVDLLDKIMSSKQ